MTEVAALLKRAVQLNREGKREESLREVQRAWVRAPADPLALNIRGMILASLGRDEEAYQDFDLALALKPDLADALNNRGTVYGKRGQFQQALACYDRSLAINPDQPHARYNSATARLVLGDWIRGFREFESRWQLFPHEFARRRNLATPWLGECDIASKTILLHHEQGYGDALQFARYAALVAQRGAKVIVAVPAALSVLMRTLPGNPEIVQEGGKVPPHDFCCPLMSLPMVFGTTPTDVPATMPYLRAPAEKVRAWKERLGNQTRRRIGLVWSGRRYPPINHPRDIELGTLLPLLEVNAEFISLQQNLTAAESALLSGIANANLVGDELQDFSDTAALVENLDLVITVDTAVAHLAGALGKPVWVMNRYASCWRWLLNRTDSPWYPSLRLFRQPTLGNWKAVIEDVRGAIEEALPGRTKISDRGMTLPHREDEAKPRLQRSDVAAALNDALGLHHKGRLGEAIEAYHRVLGQDAQQAEALHFLGVALAQLGRNEEAAALLARAVAARPSDALVHVHFGNALAGLESVDQALDAYEHALRLNENCAEAHFNRGVVLGRKGQQREALSSYERAIAANPDHAAARNNLGNILGDLGRWREAQAAYEAATTANPRFLDAWINKANAERRLHEYARAVESARRALDLAPASSEAHSSHGAVLAAMGQLDGALGSYRKALDINPQLAEGLWNKALVHLSRGEFDEGWPLYEARWKVKSLGLQWLKTDRPAWSGEPLEGKTLLLHAEQGYGDTIQFCRYAKAVKARGGRVILGVPSALLRLMRTLEDVDDVIAKGDLPYFDCHSPLLSLPGILRSDLHRTPCEPYLKGLPAENEDWNSHSERKHALRIGLAWSGNPTHSNDLNRSVPLSHLMKLLECPAQFVSLQKEVRPSDEAALSNTRNLERWESELVDFADTASLISTLDLVITVDTAIAHLAGALGKPVWILLPKVADWRWLQERTDSPWYPSARLFRQAMAGDWPDVIDRVYKAMMGLGAPILRKTSSETAALPPGRRTKRQNGRNQRA